MKRTIRAWLLSGASFLVLLVNYPLASQTPLDRYVRYGLEENLVVKQKNISVEQAEYSLQIARSYFLPAINLHGDYTSGKGGRSISIPIGDLLNPVYHSLNELTNSDEFPAVSNVSQDFFPYNFYDAKIRTSLPLVNTDLHINRTIEKQRIHLQEHELNRYKRQLVYEIKTAYYNYMSALAAVGIYESAQKLVERNVEVSESLLRNGKALPATVLRSKSEAETVRANLNDARIKVVSSKRYFNYLLNRPLETDVETMPISDAGPEVKEGNVSTMGREEMAIAETVREIQASNVQMHRASRLPKVNAFLDVGTQSSDWQFNREARYYLVGVQMSLPIFHGFRNSNNIRRSRLELENSDLIIRNTRAQLTMAAEVANDNLSVAKENYAAAEEQNKSARSYFTLVEKGFQQGVNSQIEFIDARNQLTQSALNVNLRHFELLIALAHLERETASFQF